VFFIAIYLNDKKISVFFDEVSGDIQYNHNKYTVSFNVRDIVVVKQCYPFIRTSFSDYLNISLLSGREIAVGCFISTNELFLKNKFKKKVKYVFWIEGFASPLF
jgi:hypothetical protein